MELQINVAMIMFQLLLDNVEKALVSWWAFYSRNFVVTIFVDKSKLKLQIR